MVQGTFAAAKLPWSWRLLLKQACQSRALFGCDRCDEYIYAFSALPQCSHPARAPSRDPRDFGDAQTREINCHPPATSRQFARVV